MLLSDKQIIQANTTLSQREIEFQLGEVTHTKQLFQSILDEGQYNQLRADGEFRLSHRGFLAALFINLYRDEPMLYSPFRYLTLLADIDELFTNWRQRHVVMVQRMLGTKIGTGGSSGHEYLAQTTRQNRIFTDLFKLSTFIIPRSDLPVLPMEMRKALGFFFSGASTVRKTDGFVSVGDFMQSSLLTNEAQQGYVKKRPCLVQVQRDHANHAVAR